MTAQFAGRRFGADAVVPHNGEVESPRSRNLVILLLGLLSLLTPFAVDMYLPAFGQIAAEFHSTTSVIALSLSTFFIGFSLGQILYGPLLDRFGRKPPLLVGLVVYVVASFACARATSIHALVALRLLQALGGCAAQVASIAMVRDFFPARDTAKILSLLFLIIGVSPLLAPTIGSMVITALGWRALFWFLGGLALVTLVAIAAFLPEGHTPDKEVSLHPVAILQGFGRIVRRAQFLTYSLAGAFSFAGLFTYVAGSPLLFMEGYHMNARQFGETFAVLTMGFILGNQLNVWLLRRVDSQTIFMRALVVQVVTGTIFLAAVHLHLINLPLTMVLFFLFLSSIGLTYPNAAALALAPFTRDTGSASALLGFLQMGVGALISTGIGLLGTSAIITLLWATATGALAILLAGRKAVGELVIRDENEAMPVGH